LRKTVELNLILWGTGKSTTGSCLSKYTHL
jgi:hypothetical protein